MRIARYFLTLVVVSSYAATPADPLNDSDPDIHRILQACYKVPQDSGGLGPRDPEPYWMVCDEVARRRGVAIIDAVMKYLRRYPASEENLPQYVAVCPVVFFLPPGEAKRKLQKLEGSKNEIDRSNAHELLTDLDDPDHKELVRKFRERHPKT